MIKLAAIIYFNMPDILQTVSDYSTMTGADTLKKWKTSIKTLKVTLIGYLGNVYTCITTYV